MVKKTKVSDEDIEAAMAEVYENHRSELYEIIYEYVDEEELNEDFLAQLMLDLAVSTRLNAYAAEADNPTVEGVKAELDKFAAEMNDLVVEAKREAGNFVQALADERERIADEIDEDDD
jgi:hypothetical protein